MKDFRSRVAVVTGGGSGIGAALARAFAREGARIVLADVDRIGMDAVAGDIERAGGEALSVPTDVTKLGEVEALADRAFERFGAVHIVCNNAGVGVFGSLDSATIKDWRWVLEVNLWGVIHGVHVFLPRLQAQKDEGHIVNTASMAGMAGMPGLGIYCTSKFAVVGLTESLARELKGTHLGASVLCPMIVNTQINASDRNRPDELRNESSAPAPAVTSGVSYQRVIEPSEVADRVLEAVRGNELYVLTHGESRGLLQRRAGRLDAAAAKLETI